SWGGHPASGLPAQCAARAARTRSTSTSRRRSRGCSQRPRPGRTGPKNPSFEGGSQCYRSTAMRRPPRTASHPALIGREPSFRRLFLATLGSGAGTWLALVALEVDIWVKTHSSGWVAALLIADLLPTFAIGILVGPLVDRLSRKRLLVGADIVRFGVFAMLPFTTSATQVVALASVAGVATGFFRPAVYAGVPPLVSDGG